VLPHLEARVHILHLVLERDSVGCKFESCQVRLSAQRFLGFLINPKSTLWLFLWLLELFIKFKN
jgi:hypothetical protein